MSPDSPVIPVDRDDHPGPLTGFDVVFLPATFDGDIPVYSDAAPQLITDLRAEGLSARLWHAGDAAEFVSSRGPVTDALLQVAVGIASSAGWYAIKSLLTRRRGEVHLVAVYEQEGRRYRLELTGPTAEVASELERLDPFRLEPPREGDEDGEPA